MRVAGKVIAHVPEITLTNVRFHVSESGRQRVIANKCREVHAWAIGEIVETKSTGNAQPITYNPYRSGSFTVRETGIPVTSAAFVHFTKDRGAISYLA